MKRVILAYVMFSVLIFLSSCSQRNQKLSIPLLMMDDEGNVKKMFWNIQEGQIVFDEEIFFQIKNKNHVNDFFWNGKNCFIFDKRIEIDPIKDFNSNVFTFDYGKDYLFYYKNTTLQKIEDFKFYLKDEEQGYELDLKSQYEDVLNVELEDVAISSYVVKEDTLYLLLHRFSTEKGGIELILASVDLKTKKGDFSLIEDSDTFLVSNPPMSTNVLQVQNGFIVFNDHRVQEIDVINSKAKTLLENDELSKIEDENALIVNVGMFEEYLLVVGYQFNRSDDQMFRLYLYKGSQPISQIDLNFGFDVFIPNYINECIGI